MLLYDDLKAAAESTAPLLQVTKPPVDDLKELERLASRLYAEGHEFRVEDGQVITGDLPRPKTVRFDLGGKEHIRLGLVSDPHLGGVFEQLSALKDFYRIAGEEGVDAFVNTGDMHDGTDAMHRGFLYELHAHGADNQVAYSSVVYPQVEGKETLLLGGNHDMSHWKENGVNVCRQLAAVRPDIRYVGHTAAYVNIDSLKMFLTHPSGGKPYADSYRLQKIAEALPIGDPVNFLGVGHLHIHCFDVIHGIMGMQIPCFQRQTPYLASKGLHPAIGGVIADFWMTEKGEVGQFAHRFIRYQAVEEDDYDRDVSREIAKGWSTKELVLP